MPRKSGASVEILGVYAHTPAASIVRRYANMLAGGTQSSRLKRARRELSRAVLVEALVHHPRKDYDFKFAQRGSGMNSFAWSPRLLSLDGKSIVESDIAPGTEVIRVAAWIHAFAVRQGIRTDYGSVPPQEVRPMPERLNRIFPYETVD